MKPFLRHSLTPPSKQMFVVCAVRTKGKLIKRPHADE
jgi:hypothetical protein